MTNAKKIALAAADEALAQFNAFRAAHMANGRNLNDLTEDQQREYFALHAAFCKADDKVNELDEVVRVRGINTHSVALAIDCGGKGEIDTDAGAVNIQATYVEGTPEALEALADWVEAAADYNIEERQQDASDYGTAFCDTRIERMVSAAERQAAKIRAAL
mgnify:CR=1 FL=1|tara:strand:+ start:4232 stop:4714 length:483 start_codon:yes stop_codon:yes gene_type:complete